MDSALLRRRTIALLAAYAVALHGLLLSFAPVGLALIPPSLAALCSHDSGDGTGPPAGHDVPCASLCTALEHGIAGPVPSGIAVAVVAFRHIAAPRPVNPWVPPLRVLSGPHIPRGPPLA
jgi:hypothetical protein